MSAPPLTRRNLFIGRARAAWRYKLSRSNFNSAGPTTPLTLSREGSSRSLSTETLSNTCCHSPSPTVDSDALTPNACATPSTEGSYVVLGSPHTGEGSWEEDQETGQNSSVGRRLSSLSSLTLSREEDSPEPLDANVILSQTWTPRVLEEYLSHSFREEVVSAPSDWSVGS